MSEKFLTGIVLGMVGGSLIVANSVKARQFIKNGQTEVLDKAKSLTKDNSKQKKQ